MFLSSSCVCREGIEWSDIDWVDNAECLDLVEKVYLTCSSFLSKQYH